MQKLWQLNEIHWKALHDKIHNIKSNSHLCETLEETLIVMRLVAKNPIIVISLMPVDLEIIIFTNVSIEGIGGKIHLLSSSTKLLPFRFLRNKETRKVLLKKEKGKDRVHMLNTEALDLVAGLLITVLVCILKEKSVALFCDNTPAVD